MEIPVQALQDRYAPTNACFGCGPKNEKGLRIKSRIEPKPGGKPCEWIAVCEFVPEQHHQAFPGVLNGGIAGALLDCHSNWAAVWALIERRHLDHAPPTVTSDFHVTLRRPTALDKPLIVRAWPVEIADDRVTVEASIESGGKITSTCRGTFVSVKEGHPAYYRW